MVLIKTSKIKDMVRSKGFRVEALVIQILEKVEQGGMKTLQPQHTGATQTTQESKSKCTKCANIRPEFLRFARNTQSWCADEAVAMQRRIR